MTILIGDALTRLRGLPSESAHCCVTSPPYWGLGRRWVLIELNPAYEPLIRRRTAQIGLFARGAA